MNKLILFILLVITNFIYGQDTVLIENRGEFDQMISYSFFGYTEELNPKLKKEIDSVFRTYNFEKPEYDCQYPFYYILDLDSCGYILDCIPGKNLSKRSKNRDNYIATFEDEVRSIVLKSNWQINNMVILPDSIYRFQKTSFSFEISCDPPEVIFVEDYIYEDKDNIPRTPVIFTFPSKEGLIYFDGFKKGCQE